MTDLLVSGRELLPPGMRQLPSCPLINELSQQDPGHLQILVTQAVFPGISPQAFVLPLLHLLASSLGVR